MKKALTLILTAVMVLSLNSCGDSTKPNEEDDNQIPQETIDYIAEFAEDNLSADVQMTISSISVKDYENEITVRIRAISSGGFHFIPILNEIIPLINEAAEDKDVSVGKISIDEYFDSNDGASGNLIHWHTNDGISGIYVSSDTDAPIRANIEELAELVGNEGALQKKVPTDT